MNSKKNFSLLLLLFVFYHNQSCAMNKKNSKHIVFDMSLLLVPNQSAAIKKLGAGGVALSAISGKFDQKSNLQELFGVVKLIELEQNHEEKVTWEQEEVPSAMVHWMKGKIQTPTIIDLAKEKASKKYYFKKRIHAMIEMAFDPETCSDILTPNENTFDVIDALQKNGHTVHVLGNWHADIKTSVTTRFQNLFCKINGSIIVSGDVGQVKCGNHSAIYETFLERLQNEYQVSYVDICFVEHVGAHNEQLTTFANKLQKPFTVIIANPSDIGAVTTHFTHIGILTEQNQ